MIVTKEHVAIGLFLIVAVFWGGYNLSRIVAVEKAEAATSKVVIDMAVQLATIQANTVFIKERLDRIGDAVKGMRDDMIHNNASKMHP